MSLIEVTDLWKTYEMEPIGIHAQGKAATICCAVDSAAGCSVDIEKNNTATIVTEHDEDEQNPEGRSRQRKEQGRSAANGANHPHTNNTLRCRCRSSGATAC